MSEMFLFSFLTAAAAFGILLKVDILKVVGYEILFDIGLSVGLAMLYAGTYTGTMIAILAGLQVSIYLRITRWFFGYKVFDRPTRSWIYHPR